MIMKFSRCNWGFGQGGHPNIFVLTVALRNDCRMISLTELWTSWWVVGMIINDCHAQRFLGWSRPQRPCGFSYSDIHGLSIFDLVILMQKAPRIMTGSSGCDTRKRWEVILPYKSWAEKGFILPRLPRRLRPLIKAPERIWEGWSFSSKT